MYESMGANCEIDNLNINHTSFFALSNISDSTITLKQGYNVNIDRDVVLERNKYFLFRKDAVNGKIQLLFPQPKISIDYLTFSNGLNNPEHKEGLLFYDKNKKALSYYNEDSEVTVNLGQELLIRVRNESGAPIANGSVVYPTGICNDGCVLIDLAIASEKDKCRLIGVATHTIENNSNGYVTKLGEVGGLDTSSFIGGVVYLSDTEYLWDNFVKYLQGGGNPFSHIIFDVCVILDLIEEDFLDAVEEYATDEYKKMVHDFIVNEMGE
jgi:hypothetical protein